MSRVNHQSLEDSVPDVLDALREVHGGIDKRVNDRRLNDLVLLRVSQINRCDFCVKMHTRDARAAGETNERLDSLVVWSQVDDFTPKEKAALAWAEALTELNNSVNLEPLRLQLREYFSAEEIGLLTATIAMINLWNRIRFASH